MARLRQLLAAPTGSAGAAVLLAAFHRRPFMRRSRVAAAFVLAEHALYGHREVPALSGDDGGSVVVLSGDALKAQACCRCHGLIIGSANLLSTTRLAHNRSLSKAQARWGSGWRRARRLAVPAAP